jgi:L-lactate dehydrogenase complex protein LldG
MSSREHILEKIRVLKLDQKPIPTIPDFGIKEDLQERFRASISSNKGEMITAEALIFKIESGLFPNVFSTVSDFADFTNQPLPEDSHAFANLDLAILRGQFGVAENGAIWLEDADLKLRAIPFITEHLVIVLDKNELVPTMHQAYDRIGNAASGFGLFIAGPSKTADIEQSLVIGAHGAKSLMVVLI